MIYTFTLNPSLDYVLQIGEIKNGLVNRCENGKYFAGGKGINVSKMLENLGTASVATGFCGGFTGKKLLELVQDGLCRTEFIEDGETRVNVKLNGNECTEINCHGCKISKSALEKLFTFAQNISNGDIAVFAGSVPKNADKDIYCRLTKIVTKNGAKAVVDTSGDALKEIIKSRPFLIKPNHIEIGELFGEKNVNTEKAVELAGKIQDNGVENVLVSMGGDGAVLIAADGNVYQSSSPEGKVLNTVGCGDSMVAGFIKGYTETNDYSYALKSGIAAGSATAFSEWLGSREIYNNLLDRINVTKL